ncbi:MAG: tyrosine-type recombinase/integrase, partial [Pirellulales bacterium]
DLTDQTLTMFFNWLRETTLAHSGIQSCEEVILSIARQAAEMEIIPWPMVRFKDRAVVEGAGVNGLLRFFEDRFVVDREQSGKPLAPETVKQYRTAIRSFSRFAPRIYRVDKISRVKINRFRQWLVDRGMNEKKSGNHAFAVAALVKHACPERFLDLADALPANGDASRRLAYVFEKHCLPAKQSIASEKTVRHYTAVFNSFGRHIGHVATLDDLTDEKVGSYMRELRRTGRSTRTVNGYRSKLLAIWSWCARKRIVDNFPTIEKMPEGRSLPTAWTVDELRKLLKGCERMPGTVADIPSPLWWQALHYVSWNTGERTGALLALTWQMLDPKTGQLAVPCEFRKGGKKPMLYRLKPETMQLLDAIRQPERELIFPFPMDKGTFYGRYKLLLKLAGLPYVKYKSALQKMRRSFATHLENAGGNATSALAHCLRSDTENSYLDPRLIQTTPPNELLFALEATA